MSNPKFVQDLQRLEVDIRGLYLSIACDIEYVLTDLICACIATDHKQKELIKVSLFEKVLFEKKIKMAEEVLLRYNEQHFKINEPAFKKFHELKGYRNMLAHSKLKGDLSQVDLSYVIFEVIKDGKIVDRKEYINQLKNKLEVFRQASMDLLLLVTIIYNEKGIKP